MSEFITTHDVTVVTTTINVPRIFNIMAKPTTIIIVGDHKTPHADVRRLCKNYNAAHNHVPHCTYLAPEDQERWSCSVLLGWNTIQRRNIGFLEAIRRGAKAVISIDDDNFPLEYNYVERFVRALNTRAAADVRPTVVSDWFDIGSQLIPASKQRGIPFYNTPKFSVDAPRELRVGVAQGLCLGDPDVDAASRHDGCPQAQSMSELARNGFVVHPRYPTIWNSQNTAVLTDLLPAYGMIPGVGRMDDIYASIVCRKVMTAVGLHVFFGRPAIFQSRNSHRNVADMRAELTGYEGVSQLEEFISELELEALPCGLGARQQVSAYVWQIWHAIPDTVLAKLSVGDFDPRRIRPTMLAYAVDCEAAFRKRAWL